MGGEEEGDTYDEEAFACSGRVLSCDDVRVGEIADINVGLFLGTFTGQVRVGMHIRSAGKDVHEERGSWTHPR